MIGNKERLPRGTRSEKSVELLAFILGRMLLALGLVAVAGIGMRDGEFVAKWGAPPLPFASQKALARCSDLILLIFAAGLLARTRIAAKAALCLAFLMLAWIVALHSPQLISNPKAVVRWGYLAGVVTVGSGALAVWATASGTRDAARWFRVARLLMGPALVWFGVSHLMFPSAVAVLVPAALPFKLQIAELTGCAHLAAGIAMISGVLATEAALLESIMLSGFVVLVDLPRYLSGLVRGPPWALGFEAAMAGAVWCMASALTIAKRKVPGGGT